MASQRSFLNAIKWSYTATWGERAFSAVFTVVLAALVGPRDFGVVAIALVYIGFLQMFLDQGFVAALIQRKNLDHEHADAVFWMGLGLSFVLSGLSIFLSRWWAAVNHAPQVAAIISVLSLCIPIEALAIVQKAILSREMDFKTLAIRSNASVVLSGVIGIGMACGGFGVWALVGQQISRDLSSLVLLWRLSSWRPKLQFSWAHLKELMGFSVSNFVAQLGIFADTQASSILLGLFFGPVAVGLYRLADRVMNNILVAATCSIQWVSLPEFSRFQDQPAELRKSVLTCIHLSSTLALPALAGLAAVSGPLMATLGPKWIPAAGVLKILCVLGVLLTFAFFTGPLLQALSKVRLVAILEWVRTAVGIAMLIAAGLLVRHGAVNEQILGIAVARLATAALLVAPLFVYLLMRMAGISLRDLLSSIAPSASASIGVVGAVTLVQYIGGFVTDRPPILLAGDVVVGGATGVAILFLLDVQLRTKVIGLVRKSLGVETLAKTPA
jgi:PST family polysaccharide transporter